MESAWWLVLKTVLWLCPESGCPVCYSHDFKSQFAGGRSSGFIPVLLQAWVWTVTIASNHGSVNQGVVSVLLRMLTIPEIRQDPWLNLHRLSNYHQMASTFRKIWSELSSAVKSLQALKEWCHEEQTCHWQLSSPADVRRRRFCRIRGVENSLCSALKLYPGLQS